MPADAHPQTVCGPDCRYRSLFEGSQLTLTDMAARQAEALGRLGRVRAAVIKALRHADPDGFAAAERELGGRFNEAEDEVLLAALDRSVVRGPTRPSLETLRAALAAAGVQLPSGEDPTAWAAAVTAAGLRPAPAPTPAAAPAPRTAAGLRPPSTPAPAAVPATEPVPAPVTAQVTEPAPFALRPPSGAVRTEAPKPAEVEDLGDLFADDPVEVPLEDLGDLFADDPGPSEPPLDELVDLFADDPGPSEPPLDELVDLFADDPGPEPARPPVPTTPSPAEPAAAVAEPSPPPANKATDAPLRPMLLPRPTRDNGRRRTGGRAAKVRAIPPEFDAAGEGGTAQAVPETVEAKLRAAVAVPRPMFIEDLRSVVPDPGVLDAWETAMRGDLANSPVRFIPAKTRHRSLGALVLPRDYLRDAATEFDTSWWSECINLYRGTRLYELGVLLRRVGTEVVAYDAGSDVMVLRCNGERGLVGLVVALTAELGAGTTARTAVAEAVGELLRERLALVGVLAVNDTAMAPLRALLAEEAVTRRWRPTMPVAVARSWEWADNRGTAADIVLGG